MMENNVHNFNKFALSANPPKNDHLFLILAVAAALIGAELLWAQIISVNYDLDNYSASIFSVTADRGVVEAAQLRAEVDDMEMINIEIEADFRSIDAQIEASL